MQLVIFQLLKFFPMHAGVTMCPSSSYQWSVHNTFLPNKTATSMLLNVFPDTLRDIQEDCELSF